MIPLTQLLSQRDPSWANRYLGETSMMVGDWGCTLTASVMAAQAFGKNLTMHAVLDEMNKQKGFNAGGSLDWRVLAKALGLEWGYRWETDADLRNKFERVKEVDGFRHIEWLASVGIPTVVFVDTNHDEKPNHWVTYIGDGKVADPWDGQIKPMSTFERLYGYAVFTGTPVLTGGKVAVLIGKANEIAQGRNITVNAKEIIQTVIRP